MKFKDFEIRPAHTIDGLGIPNRYELIKWYRTDKPVEVTDLRTGDKNMQDLFCYVIAFLEYNDKEPCWEFRSVGFRYLKDREDGLEAYIQAYTRLIDACRNDDEDENW